MNKVVNSTIKSRCLGLIAGAGGVLVALLQPAMALSLDATRYIFTGDKDALTVTVSNPTDQLYGGQVWVENIVEEDTRPSFVVTPPFFKVKPADKQVVRIIKAVDLPQDKESIYWLNVQEIPPALEGSGMVVAVRSRVKFFYRPAALLKSRQGAEKRIELQPVKTGLLMKNTTPHVFVIPSVMNSAGAPLELEKKAAEKLLMFMPGDEVIVPFGAAKVMSVDDMGGQESYAIGQQNSTAGKSGSDVKQATKTKS